MDIHESFSLLSLGATPLAITSCLGVIYIWFKPALRSIFVSDRTEVQWFMLGVIIGFSGSLIDNIYWGLAWTADFTSHELREWLFRNGVYQNSISRQLATIVAGLCHIKASHETGDKILKYTLFSGGLIGILYTFYLYESVFGLFHFF